MKNRFFLYASLVAGFVGVTAPLLFVATKNNTCLLVAEVCSIISFLFCVLSVAVSWSALKTGAVKKYGSFMKMKLFLSFGFFIIGWGLLYEIGFDHKPDSIMFMMITGATSRIAVFLFRKIVDKDKESTQGPLMA